MTLPEWLPNIHPMIVHFPIAIVIIAVFFDLFSQIFPKKRWIRPAAISLYVLAAVFVLSAFLSGRAAADSVTLSLAANAVLNEHADLGTYSMWFFLVIGFIQIMLYWQKVEQRWLNVGLLVAAIGGVGLILETAEHGGELVYKHGVGVQAVAGLQNAIDNAREEGRRLAKAGVVELGNHSWQWYPAEKADVILADDFKWMQGTAAMLRPSIENIGNAKSALSLRPGKSPALFVYGEPLTGVQMDVKINADQFHGRLQLVHHLKDSLNYDFLSLQDGKMKLGRLQNGTSEIIDEKDAPTSGWFTLRTVGEGRHFRGYINGKMIVHGHANEMPPGLTGIRVDGAGKLLFGGVNVQALK